MEIDPFTFVAQLVNFAILVWFLKRFLFDRVARYLDRRTRKAEEALAAAEAERSAAAAAAAEARALRERIEAESGAFLADARARAEAESLQAARRAREREAAELEAWRSSLAARREGFLGELREGAEEWLGELSRRALSDLAGADLGPRFVSVFVRKIAALEAPELEALRKAALADKLAIVSDFELGENEVREVGEALAPAFGFVPRLPVRLDGEGRRGIALESGGFRLGWGFGDYVDEVQSRMAGIFDAELPRSELHDG